MVEAVSFHRQLLLDLFNFSKLDFQLLLSLVQFAIQIFNLPVLVIFDQLQFILGSLELTLHLGFLFLPVTHLSLEQLNLIFKIVHVDLHFMLETDMASDITLKLLNQLFIFSGWATHVVTLPRNVRAGRFLSLHHRLNCILHRLLDQIIRGDRHLSCAKLTSLRVLLK